MRTFDRSQLKRFNSVFKILKNTADKLNLKELSMGMSSDYEKALTNGSTFLRLGTVILGERKKTI